VVTVSGDVGYVVSGDVHLAYQVLGHGATDVLMMTGMFLPMEALTDEAAPGRFVRKLATFCRVILFDRRGIGMSDPVSLLNPPTMEQWMQDALAVLDAVGSTRVDVVASGDGAMTAMMLGATHPDRVRALVLIHGTARLARTDVTPWGRSEELQQTYERGVERDTGSGLPVEIVAPSVAADPVFRAWLARAQRRGASPGVAKILARMIYDTDLRAVIPAVRLPTLIVHRVENRYHDVEHSRDLARRIPDARLVEVPGTDHFFFTGDIEPIIEEIQEFLTGVRGDAELDRVLSTVLFTDIVGSTKRAATLGDHRWRELLDDHDVLVRRQLARFRGIEIKATGDGVLATFDGPARAIHGALAIRDAVHQVGLDIRCGIHTGEVELRGTDVGGIAIHIGARVVEQAQSGEVLVSRTVTDLVAGSGIRFSERGEHELKGVPGTWLLFAVEG
jgi:pimeloyl-ACP methyl ester carboxylesterase/class 3 adenylate cyclase